MAVKIFFCYAHEDEPLLKKLQAHLTSLVRSGLIDRLWYDREINAGTEWEKEIDKYLNTAHIILLLVSSDFMASDYCYSVEMKRALERHERGEAVVIPVILRHVHWQKSLIAKLQAMPTDGKPVTSWHDIDEALYNVVVGIDKSINEFLLQDASQIAKHTEQIVQVLNRLSALPVTKNPSSNQLLLAKNANLQRIKLVEKLNDVIETLYEATRKDKNFRMGVFLHQSININADEDTLVKIIEDVEKHTHLRMTEPEKF
jgi:TIR domain